MSSPRLAEPDFLPLSQLLRRILFKATTPNRAGG